MDRAGFKTLFGTDIHSIKETCIVMPFFPPPLRHSLSIKQTDKGAIYHCHQLEHVTLIKSGIGDTLTGDCILWLKNAPCKRILFVGSAGLTQKHSTLNIGSLTLLSSCIAHESFTQTLQHNHQTTALTPSAWTQTLTQKFNLTTSTGISIGSIACEKEYINYFNEHKIDVVDMESSAAIAAAQHINKEISVLLFITDIVGEKPFWEIFTQKNSAPTNDALKNISDIITAMSA